METKSFIGAHGKEWEDDCLRSHPEVEVTMIMEGAGIFRTSERDVQVSAGNIVLIPADVPHSFHASTPIRFAVILAERLPVHVQALFDQLIEEQQPRIIALSPLDQEHYDRLFREWLRIYSSRLKDPLRHHAVWIEMLLLFLTEHGHANQQAMTVSFIGDYIRQHVHSSVKVKTLAEMAGLSEGGLRKQFYKTYGMTPKQYQQQCRLTEAKWLLSSSDKDIQTIAAMVGFSLLHSFSLWFKKWEGCSPSDWRQRQRLDYH
ncbi:helix-turn-helix domain-containing protein [Litoribacterium kuwaitense]|uniref:helix-turn-helix domain-containing protein n=1 Tax=Litoribacterium kuwaitense TaxID=1398745 RepID=UPI001FEC54E7|nr:AraC family transcriptional regulator [Litoribacterium kuwaitense]